MLAEQVETTTSAVCNEEIYHFLMTVLLFVTIVILAYHQVVICPCKSDTFSFFGCLQSKTNDDDESEHAIEFTGGNLNLITTIEQWEQKLAEAKTDGKVVSLSTFCLSRQMHFVEIYLVVPFQIYDML